MSDKMRKIVAGAGLMALAYALSRLLGLAREMVIAWKFGATTLTDIYNASFLIPDILNYMLAGGAFSIVLVPMLARHVSDGPSPEIDEEGSRIFSAILTPLALAVTALTVVFLVLAPQISALLYPDFARQPERFQLLVQLTRLILPAQIFFVVGGLINSTLRARGDFRGNAWGPNLYNLGIILGGVVLAAWFGIAGLSLGVLAGAAAGPFLVCWWLSRGKVRYRFSLDLRSPEFLEFIRLNLPLMIGFSLLTVDEWFVRYFGAKGDIAAGTITCLRYARTLMLMPIGLVGQTAGQASLTYLAQLWQQDRREEYTRTFSQTLRGVMFLSLLLVGGLFLAAQPLTTLLFYRGAFTATNNLDTANLLQWMVFAIPAFATQQTLLNGYYARKNTLRPMIISTLTTGISYLVYDSLRRAMLGPGIALATSICFWLMFLVMLADYHRRYGRGEGLPLGDLARTTLKGAGIALAGAAAVWLGFVRFHMLPLDPLRKMDAALLLAVMGTAYGGLILLLSLLAGGEEAAAVKKIIAGLRRRLQI